MLALAISPRLQGVHSDLQASESRLQGVHSDLQASESRLLGEDKGIYFNISVGSPVSAEWPNSECQLVGLTINHRPAPPTESHVSHWASWRQRTGLDDNNIWLWRKFLISSHWRCTQLRTWPNHYCTAKDHLKSFLVSERRGKVQKCSACVGNWCWQEWATLTWTIRHQLSHRSYRYFVTCNRSDLLHKQTPIAVLRWGGVSLTCAKPWLKEWGVWLRSCYTVSYTDKNKGQVQVVSCDRHVTTLWG